MEWTQLPAMPTDHPAGQAAYLTFPDGSSGLVVAGGERLVNTDFLDFDTMTWTPKAEMLLDVNRGASVPYRYCVVHNYNDNCTLLLLVFNNTFKS